MPETPEQILRRLAFNALTKGLGTCEQYLLLSERERIAKAVLAAVLPEHEKQVRAKAAEPIRAREQELLEQMARLNAQDHYATARGVEVAAYEVRRIADELARGAS